MPMHETDYEGFRVVETSTDTATIVSSPDIVTGNDQSPEIAHECTGCVSYPTVVDSHYESIPTPNGAAGSDAGTLAVLPFPGELDG